MTADCYAYTGLFLAALLSATVLPAASEITLVGLLNAGAQPVATLLAVATAGNTAGAALNWALGRFLIHYRDRRWFPLRPARYEQVRAWFGRYGLWTLLFSWLPVVGDPLTLVAGAARVPFGRFLVLVAAGKAARYTALAGLTLGWEG